MIYKIRKSEKTSFFQLETEAAFSTVKSYMESEIQQNIAFCDLLRDRIGGTDLSQFSLTGNLYEITKRQNIITLSNLHDETDTQSLNTEDFLRLLDDWRKTVTETS